MSHLKSYLRSRYGWSLVCFLLACVLAAQTGMPESLGQQLSTSTDAEEQAELILEYFERHPTLDDTQFDALYGRTNRIADSLNLAQLSAQANYFRLAREFRACQNCSRLPLIAEELKGLANFFGGAKETFWQLRTQVVLANAQRELGEQAVSETLVKQVLQASAPFQESPRFAGIIGDAYRIRGNMAYGSDFEQAKQAYQLAQQYYERGDSSLRPKQFLVLQNVGILAGAWKYWEEMHTAYQALLDFCQPSDSTFLGEAYLEYGISIAKEFETQAVVGKQIDILFRSNEQLQRALRYPSKSYTRLYYQLGANQQNLVVYGTESIPLKKESRDSLLQLAGHYYSECIKASTDEDQGSYLEKVFKTALQIHSLNADNGTDDLQQLLLEINEGYLNTYAQLKMQNDSLVTLSDNNLRLNKEISESKIERNRQNFLIGAVIALGLFLALYQRQRYLSLRKRTHVRMEALRSQMNSHFISNTLAAIDTLIMQGKKEEASQHVISFSRLCREVLDFSKRSLITLQDEVNVVRRYLSFEKLRLRERLQIVWEVDDELDLDTLHVPSLLLQPFAENAIWHGILNKPDQAPGTLRIGIHDVGANSYCCTIVDNGIGRAAAQKLQAQSEVEWQSWSMNITQERIAHLKKINAIGIQTEDLYATDGQPSGTRVAITLPKTLKSLR